MNFLELAHRQSSWPKRTVLLVLTSGCWDVSVTFTKMTTRSLGRPRLQCVSMGAEMFHKKLLYLKREPPTLPQHQRPPSQRFSPHGLQSPLEGSHIRYPAYQIFALQSMAIAKSRYEMLMKAILWLEVTRTRGAILKGHRIRKVENCAFKLLMHSLEQKLVGASRSLSG